MISDEKEQRKEESILLKSEIENLKVKITENEKNKVDLVCGKKVESFKQSFSQDTFDRLKTTPNVIKQASRDRRDSMPNEMNRALGHLCAHIG